MQRKDLKPGETYALYTGYGKSRYVPSDLPDGKTYPWAKATIVEVGATVEVERYGSVRKIHGQITYTVPGSTTVQYLKTATKFVCTWDEFKDRVARAAEAEEARRQHDAERKILGDAQVKRYLDLGLIQGDSEWETSTSDFAVPRYGRSPFPVLNSRGIERLLKHAESTGPLDASTIPASEEDDDE